MSIGAAFKLFNEMVFQKNIPPNVVTYNSLIYALCKLGRWDEVTLMLYQMEDEKVSPTLRTYNILVDTLCKQGKVKEAHVVFDIMGKSHQYPPDLITHNSLIYGYCLRREMMNAKKILELIWFRGIKPNVVTYNTLIDGYIEDMDIKEALPMSTKVGRHIANMVTHYVVLKLDSLTELNMLKSQVEEVTDKKKIYKLLLQNDAYELDHKLALFHFLDSRELNLDIDAYNILIDLAIKYGKFDIATRLFHDLLVKGVQPDFETYKLMITAFCRVGQIKDANRLWFKLDVSLDNVILSDIIRSYSNVNVKDIYKYVGAYVSDDEETIDRIDEPF